MDWLERIREHGVVGAGGAGFPTWKKLQKPCDTVILNCAESEPLLTLHSQLLANHPQEILSALGTIAKELGARPIAAVGQRHTFALEAVQSQPDIPVQILPDRYPAGDEVQVVYTCLGRLTPPMELPQSVGAVVLNVETLFNIYNDRPVTHKYVTVGGAVRNPMTLHAPLGKPLADLVYAAGGATESDTVWMIGGPMMGTLAQPGDVVGKTTNACLVFPRNHSVIKARQIQKNMMMHRARAACCHCEVCSQICPRALLGYPAAPHRFMRAVGYEQTNDSTAFLNAMHCCGCGLCELFACGQGLSPRALIRDCAAQLKQASVSPSAAKTPSPHPMRAFRGVPRARLLQRLDLVRYDHPAPIREV